MHGCTESTQEISSLFRSLLTPLLTINPYQINFLQLILSEFLFDMYYIYFLQLASKMHSLAFAQSANVLIWVIGTRSYVDDSLWERCNFYAFTIALVKALQIFMWTLLEFINIRSMRFSREGSYFSPFLYRFPSAPRRAESSRSRQEGAVEKFEWLNSWSS